MSVHYKPDSSGKAAGFSPGDLQRIAGLQMFSAVKVRFQIKKHYYLSVKRPYSTFYKVFDKLLSKKDIFFNVSRPYYTPALHYFSPILEPPRLVFNSGVLSNVLFL